MSANFLACETDTGITDTTSTSVGIAGAAVYDAFDRLESIQLGETPSTPSERLVASWRRHFASQDLEEIIYQPPGLRLTRVVRSKFLKDGSPKEEVRDGTIDAVGTGVDLRKSFTYDPQGRLSQQVIVKNGSTISNQSFTYSPNGRMLTGGGSTYSYARNDLPGAVTSLGTRALTYDSAGNAITDSKSPSRTFTWAANGCMSKATLADGGSLTQKCDLAGNAVYRASKSGSTGTLTEVVNLGGSEYRPTTRTFSSLLIHRLPINGTVLLEAAYSIVGSRITASSRIVMSDSRGSILATAPLYGTSLPTTRKKRSQERQGTRSEKDFGKKPAEHKKNTNPANKEVTKKAALAEG
jgi:hypothetical protein